MMLDNLEDVGLSAIYDVIVTSQTAGKPFFAQGATREGIALVTDFLLGRLHPGPVRVMQGEEEAEAWDSACNDLGLNVLLL